MKDNYKTRIYALSTFVSARTPRNSNIEIIPFAQIRLWMYVNNLLWMAAGPILRVSP